MACLFQFSREGMHRHNAVVVFGGGDRRRRIFNARFDVVNGRVSEILRLIDIAVSRFQL